MNRNSPDKTSAGDDSRPVSESKKYGLFTRSALAVVLSLVCAKEVEAKNPQYFDFNDMNRISCCDRVKQKPDLKVLLKTPWEEIEAKLNGMTFAEISEIAYQFATVADDAGKMPDIGDKLKINKVLDESEKTSFLDMAMKYNIKSLTSLRSILSKKEPAPQDCQSLLNSFKEILERQISATESYIQIRIWLNTTLALSDLFESPEDFRIWSEDNIERIKAFAELARMLKDYKLSFDK